MADECGDAFLRQSLLSLADEADALNAEEDGHPDIETMPFHDP
jgi:hypothetical protein